MLMLMLMLMRRVNSESSFAAFREVRLAGIEGKILIPQAKKSPGTLAGAGFHFRVKNNA